MALALALARKGLYTTDPNPRVGCVIVRDGAIVGQGWHERAGEAHAEINALHEAGDKAKGAEVYLTLEPCCHHGRTPPCTDALIAAGVAKVVIAMLDPNPKVAGQGVAQLQQAGITVQQGLMEAQAAALNPGFIKRMKTGRPFVRCKLAMSLDGRTAMASGQSKWITGPEARKDVQRLRARSSAIMTGISTVLMDNPGLNVRDDEFSGDEKTQIANAMQPLRVIVDSHVSVPAEAKILKQAGETLIVAAHEEVEPIPAYLAESDKVAVVRMPRHGGTVNLHALMEHLGEMQVNEVLLEAGSTLSGSMLRAGLIDELVIYMAPKLMGNQAKGLFNLPDLKQMDQSIEIDIMEIVPVGGDWRITGKPKVVVEKQ